MATTDRPTAIDAAALTNTCGMGSLLAKLPYNRGASCDIDAVGQLASTEPGPV